MIKMSRAGISPVIAEVILVAIAIAIAIAVAFWATGITTSFTRFEKLEITSAYSTSSNPSTEEPSFATASYVVLRVRNTGPTDVTVDDLFINGKPLSAVNVEISLSDDSSVWGVYNTSISKALPTGDTVYIAVAFRSTNYSVGQTVEIAVHTATGRVFPAAVTLI